MLQAQDMPLSQILIPGEGWKVRKNLSSSAIRCIASNSRGDVHAVFGDGMATWVVKEQAIYNSAFNQAGVTSIAVGPDKEVFSCQPNNKQILVGMGIDRKAIVPNEPTVDCVVLHDGGLYCAVPSKGKILYLNPKQKKITALQGNRAFAHLVLWPNQGTLVAAPAQGSHLFAFRIDEKGKLVDGEKYYALRTTNRKKTTRIGGMTVDSVGRLYVATGEGVQVFDTTGRLSGVLPMPENAVPLDVAFGGKSLDLLFVATKERLYYRKTKAKRPIAKKK